MVKYIPRAKSGETCSFQRMSSYSEGDTQKNNKKIDVKNITVTMLQLEIVKLKGENDYKKNNIVKVFLWSWNIWANK